MRTHAHNPRSLTVRTLVIGAAIGAAFLLLPHAPTSAGPEASILGWDQLPPEMTAHPIGAAGPTATARPTVAPTPARTTQPSETPDSDARALPLTPARAAAAYRVALQAIAYESGQRDDCADDTSAAEDCSAFLFDFLAGISVPTPVYQPDRFVGVTWRCGDETCYAGAVWTMRNGKPARQLQTGP